MKTIEKYERMYTPDLQSLLKKFEDLAEENEILIDKAKFNNQDYDKLRSINDDYDIDISLLRMELNRRFWKSGF